MASQASPALVAARLASLRDGQPTGARRLKEGGPPEQLWVHRATTAAAPWKPAFPVSSGQERGEFLAGETLPALPLKCVGKLLQEHVDKTIKVFPNQKPWLDSTVKPLLKACDAAYRSGDKLAYSIARKELKKGIKLAKSRDFLTNRPQVVRIGDNTSSTLVLSTGTPQGCVLSPALFTLFTSDCSAIHSTNTIVKFADDTTIVGLISDNE
ncbi:hypothetical protein L3Q82_022681 [Scortum barcoo]|uniref:Uncharacterized protein n=1 Tax=Scortum barcoo TaxID=214431 RepID=A0ACB8WXP2_9TELE|nr:hypothetical protein L3Q82_022681 [Scortum barcoo]